MTNVQRLAEELAKLPKRERLARLRGCIGSLSLAERFDLLHALGIYHGEESMSGDGSTARETAALRRALPRLLREHAVASLLDVPCGDFHWMSRVDLEGVDYLGADIVPDLVEQNRRRYGRAGRRFAVLDATRDPLPRVDLVLCRDLVIHLGLADIGRLLANLTASGSRLLLATHFATVEHNAEIESGDFRPVNLCRPPFDLPGPLEVISEHSQLAGGAFADRSMALWRLADLG